MAEDQQEVGYTKAEHTHTGYMAVSTQVHGL